MSSPSETPPPKAVLVGVQLPGVTDAEQRSSLMELRRLRKTLGFEVVGEVTQKRKGLGAATLIGEGKLVELAAWTGGTGGWRRAILGGAKPVSRPFCDAAVGQRAHSQGGRTLARGRPARQGPARAGSIPAGV